jgi:hypothetical protein
VKFEINTDNMTYFDLWLLRNLVNLMHEQAQNPINLQEETIGTEPQPQPQEAKRRKKKSDHLKVVETPEPEAPAPEPETAPASAPASAPAPEPTGPALTIDDMRVALQSFSRKNGVPASVELLKKYNASRISDLAVDRYTDFLKECGA